MLVRKLTFLIVLPYINFARPKQTLEELETIPEQAVMGLMQKRMIEQK